MAYVRSSRINTFVAIFSHKAYIAVAAASAIAFYYMFYYIVTSDNLGAFLLFIPIYFIYALVATSGILFAISVFAMAHSAVRRLGVEGGIIGVLLPSVGSIVAGCACAFPLLASVLLFIGINTFEAAGIVSLVGGYQLWIDIAMILINVGLIYYYLGRLHMPKQRKSGRNLIYKAH